MFDVIETTHWSYAAKAITEATIVSSSNGNEDPIIEVTKLKVTKVS